jgi:hypothetical protein
MDASAQAAECVENNCREAPFLAALWEYGTQGLSSQMESVDFFTFDSVIGRFLMTPEMPSSNFPIVPIQRIWQHFTNKSCI